MRILKEQFDFMHWSKLRQMLSLMNLLSTLDKLSMAIKDEITCDISSIINKEFVIEENFFHYV